MAVSVAIYYKVFPPDNSPLPPFRVTRFVSHTYRSGEPLGGLCLLNSPLR